MYKLASNLNYLDTKIYQPVSGLGVNGKNFIFESINSILYPYLPKHTKAQSQFFELLSAELADRGIIIPEANAQNTEDEISYLTQKFPLKPMVQSTFFRVKSQNLSTFDYGNYDIAFFSVPSDFGSTRPGTRYGPEILREQSLTLNYRGLALDLRTKKTYNLSRVCDLGVYNPAEYEGHSIYDNLINIYKKINKSVIPIMIGGDHSLTYSAVSALSDRHQKLSYVHLDSHTDVQNWGFNKGLEKIVHSNFVSKILKIKPEIDIHQVGVKNIVSVAESDKSAFLTSIDLLKSQSFEADSYETIVQDLPKKRKVYLSIDVDVFASDIISQTGYPNPNGLTINMVNKIIQYIVSENEIVGVDLMEFGKSRERDIHRREAQILSQLLLEIIYAIQQNKQVKE